jgi:hypothetical protein
VSFTLIQLLEYFIWKSIDTNISNEFYTKLVPLVLFIQPVVQTYFAWTKVHDQNLFILLIMYIIIFFFTLITINNFKYNSEIGENKHLIWYKINKKSNNKTTILQRDFVEYFYLFGMGIGLYYTKQYLLLFYGIASYHFIRNNYPQDEFSSMWCFVAVFYSILAFF